MWRWALALILPALVFGGFSWVLRDAYQRGETAGFNRRDAMAWKADRDALARQVAQERQTAQRAAVAATDAVQAKERVRVVYRTIEREVPTYVTHAIDARYPLPWAFIRVHDAAALGVPAGALPDPAAGPDDAPSPIAASAAVSRIAGNYESCRLNAERLSGLQAWVRAVSTP